METLNYINIDKEELENEIGTEIKSADDLVDYMRKNDADEVDNGAESVFRLELKSGKYLFFETVNDVVSIEPSESWNGYFAQWDEGEDKALERFCLGKEISYEVAEPDYDGEVRIYIKYNEIDPIYCRDGWERDDWGDEIRYESYADAYATIDHNDRYVQNGCFDPAAYIICKA